RSCPRPRTPTMAPSLTAMSMASPSECRIDAEGTQRSTSLSATPSARWVSTRTGQISPGPYGVRVPQGSAIRSTIGHLPRRRPSGRHHLSRSSSEHHRGSAGKRDGAGLVSPNPPTAFCERDGRDRQTHRCPSGLTPPVCSSWHVYDRDLVV